MSTAPASPKPIKPPPDARRGNVRWQGKAWDGWLLTFAHATALGLEPARPGRVLFLTVAGEVLDVPPDQVVKYALANGGRP